MPTTYTPLATQTVSGSSTTSVTFTGISGAYTDLVMVASIASSDAGQTFVCRLNGDSGSNYSITQMSGEGTSAVSRRESNQTRINISRDIGVGTTLGNMVVISNFQNYSNTTTNKTVLSRISEAVAGFPGVGACVGLWRNTAAITSIEFFMSNGTATFVAGSTFSLYGIASAAVVSGAKATGGDVVATDGTYWYHAFRTSGTFTPNEALTCDVLVVAGGGSGGAAHGNQAGGGGGAGGYQVFNSQALTTTNYAVTIGGGGAGVNTNNLSAGNNGTNSQFGSLTASVGGGRGGSFSTAPLTGGSGGGGANQANITGAAGTAGQGNAGGNGSATNSNGAGGGGGAGATGGNFSGGNGGTGGAGVNTQSTWATVTGTGVSGFYAGGGGGSPSGNGTTGGTGGSGGGSTGTFNANSANGTANTGSGSGGAYSTTTPTPNYTSGNGGSGLVIVRYAV